MPETIRVYKTKESHTGGHDVYRRCGVPAQTNSRGLLGGEYFVEVGTPDSPQFCTVGKAYKEGYTKLDGEPEYPIENIKEVKE